jgi:hypothetical protein
MRIDRRAVLGAFTAVSVCLGLCGVGQARVPKVVPRPSLAVVDAIGDGGPDADDWNPALAAAIRSDHPKVLLWAGDVRNKGTAAEWRRYDALYGPLVNLTLPTPGNHDWLSRAIGYNIEFARDPLADTTTYCNAVILGGWRLFAINTYTRTACLPKLKLFLAARGTHKIVLTHEPRWSGGVEHGSILDQAPIWDAMRGHAIVLVSGHDHNAQVIVRDGLVQVVSGCAGAPYVRVVPIAGEVYYSKSAADCTFTRLLLGPAAVFVQEVRGNGQIAFSRRFPSTR